MTTEAQSPPSLQARATARIEAILRGPERGMLILGILFLIVFLSSLSFVSWLPTPWAKFGMVIGLVGLLVLLCKWCQHRPDSYPIEGPPLIFNASEKGVTASVPVRDPAQMMALVREALQNRQPPVAPHGAVDKGRPETPDALREYSIEERERLLHELHEGVTRHDQDLINQLREIEKRLPRSAIPDNVELPVQGPIEEDRTTGE